MKKLISNYLSEIQPYKTRWYGGLFMICILGLIGIVSILRDNGVVAEYVLLAFTFMTVCLWTALTLSNSRIIRANKKLEGKNGL